MKLLKRVMGETGKGKGERGKIETICLLSTVFDQLNIKQKLFN